MGEKKVIPKIIFDCNIWMEIFFEDRIDLIKNVYNKYEIIITSYCVVETLRVLRRISTKLRKSYFDLESLMCEIWNLPCINQEFDHPISNHLIPEIKNCTENKMLSKLLNVETKDVPYIIAAYKFDAILVSKDFRSLTQYADELKSKLGINVMNWDQFLDSVSLGTRKKRSN